MLAEIKETRQIHEEGYRRWFTDDDFDLIVWYDARRAEAPPDPVAGLKGFQLCYDKTGRERALTWTLEHGFQHNRIDAGEIPGHAKMTPVIMADGDFSHETVAEMFRARAAGIDPALARFVYAAVKGYPRKPVP